MALLDQYGRPVQIQQLTQPQAAPAVTGVRQVWTDTMAAGLTPQSLAGILRGCDQGELKDFLTLAEEMEERDLHYLAVLGIRKRVISGVKPTVLPGGEDAKAKEIAEAVTRDIAEHDGFAGLVESLLDALGKGFSVVEIDWHRDANLWTPGAFLHRDPRFFVFDKATGQQIRVLSDAEPREGEELRPYRFLTHRAAMKSGLAYRGGLARFVAFGWMCKAYTAKDWMAFIETYGLPLRLGKYPANATKNDVTALMRAVANIGTDAAAVVPEAMNIEFVTGPAGTGQAVFENFARWVDEQVSKGVLGQTMTSDNGSSQSQATVHNEVRHDIAASDARGISSTINRDLVRAYVDLNFGVQESYPKILIEVAEPEDIKAKIDGAVSLMQQGVRFKATELRGKLGFSDPEDGDELAGGQAQPAEMPPPKEQKRDRQARNREGGGDPIDDIAGTMLDDWEELADGMQGAIAEAIGSATSYEQMLTQLPEALRHMPTALAVDTLVKGLFKARATGDTTDG